MGSACTNKNCFVEMFISTTSGAIAGVMSWILVIPFDVMKTITQAQSDPDKQRNMRSLLKTKRNVSDFVSVSVGFWIEGGFIRLQEHGWRIFFRGSWMLIVRSIPVNAVTFLGEMHFLVTIFMPQNKNFVSFFPQATNMRLWNANWYRIPYRFASMKEGKWKEKILLQSKPHRGLRFRFRSDSIYIGWQRWLLRLTILSVIE